MRSAPWSIGSSSQAGPARSSPLRTRREPPADDGGVPDPRAEECASLRMEVPMVLARSLTVVVSLGLVLAVARAPASAQGTRISLPPPRLPGFGAEDTFAFRASSDGAWVVYLADDEVND